LQFVRNYNALADFGVYVFPVLVGFRQLRPQVCNTVGTRHSGTIRVFGFFCAMKIHADAFGFVETKTVVKCAFFNFRQESIHCVYVVRN